VLSLLPSTAAATPGELQNLTLNLSELRTLAAQSPRFQRVLGCAPPAQEGRAQEGHAEEGHAEVHSQHSVAYSPHDPSLLQNNLVHLLKRRIFQTSI